MKKKRTDSGTPCGNEISGERTSAQQSHQGGIATTLTNDEDNGKSKEGESNMEQHPRINLELKRYENGTVCSFHPGLVHLAAKWYASHYKLMRSRVYDILDRTVLREPIILEGFAVEEVSVAAVIDHMVYDPSLPLALTYLDPEFALELFESESKETIHRVSLCAVDTNVDRFPPRLLDAIELIGFAEAGGVHRAATALENPNNAA